MAKMNNFSTTTTETLPKSGHVTEVCKEWLVREDGALAYKLQSQEINDFYKGNRTRNAVVREDFPTALQEQIKEKETAEKQAEAYRRRLREQEEHDKRVAKEIADKLERGLREQKLRELRDSEKVAQQMQEIYVNLPPVPPPTARDKTNKVPPPRPAKSSTLQQPHQTQNGYRNPNSPPFPIVLQQHHFSNTDGYVGLVLQATPSQQRNQHQRSPTNTNHIVKLSPEKYDQMVGNMASTSGGGACSSTSSASASVAAKDKLLQEHADDIELYVDPCDYASLKEIGLPMQEIKEMSAKLKQEQKDALLARRLQELEVHDGMSLEERDRLLAIEAQDKELAKMLQERMDFTTWDILRPGCPPLTTRPSLCQSLIGVRLETLTGMFPRFTTKGLMEKAKAKRAKEKARQRKSQQKEPQIQSNGVHGTLHNGPLQPIPSDCMTTSSSTTIRHSHSLSNDGSPQYQTEPIQEDHPLDLEAYSSPIDVLKHTQRTQNGCLTNGSLTRDLASQQARHASLTREDDIYTLPVDSCRPNGSAVAATTATATSTRPSSMSVAGTTENQIPTAGYSQNSMTRSENYSIHSHDSLNSRLSSGSKTQTFDQSSSPTPPYMPIQGTRRSNSSEDRKKKSKDNKCTHQ